MILSCYDNNKDVRSDKKKNFSYKRYKKAIQSGIILREEGINGQMMYDIDGH